MISNWKDVWRTEPAFTVDIKSSRTRAAFFAVWNTLPPDVSAQLDVDMFLVTDARGVRPIVVALGDCICWGKTVNTGKAGYFVWLNAHSLSHMTDKKAQYVIAHELAHVFLKWDQVDDSDPEQSADALAKRWGWQEYIPKE